MKLLSTSFMQKMSQGAIGVTNPSSMTAGLATRPALVKTEAGLGLTNFMFNQSTFFAAQQECCMVI
jgi:hypothetical protein